MCASVCACVCVFVYLAVEEVAGDAAQHQQAVLHVCPGHSLSGHLQESAAVRLVLSLALPAQSH